MEGVIIDLKLYYMLCLFLYSIIQNFQRQVYFYKEGVA